MALFIILCLLVALVVYLLFVPLVLYLDTFSNQYYVQIRGLVKANIEADKDEIVKVKMRLLFMHFEFYPLKKMGKSRKKKSSKKRRNQPKKRSRRFLRKKKIWRLAKSFKVKHFFVNIDTDNFVANAQLYPAFSWVNHWGGQVYVNFQGQNQLRVDLRNRPIYIIKAII